MALLIGLAACGSKSPPPLENTSGPPPATGTVELRGEATTGGHALVIDNHTDAPLHLRRDILVERASGGGWTTVEASSLYLRDHCEVPGDGLYEPPACVEIPAHATFRAATWTDSIGDSQCMCEECGPVGAGSYRFAVTPCDGSPRLETQAFDVRAR